MAGLPPTERLHPRSRLLDALPLPGALRLLHGGDLAAARAVGRALPALARVAGLAAGALAGGGRLVYAGAGTSGRLAAADAAECPPTFGVAASRVRALVAGGAIALRRAVEGAEDDAAARVLLLPGPELLAGSTRMKAGAATKMALALLSTGAMLRLGRVQAGRMIDLAPASAKLRRRAVRMVMELGGAGEARARRALARAGWSVRAALEELER